MLRQALDSLHSAERGLLADHLARLEVALAPGLTRLNWNSLAVSDFAAGVDKASGLAAQGWARQGK